MWDPTMISSHQARFLLLDLVNPYQEDVIICQQATILFIKSDKNNIIYVNAQITDATTALGRLMHDFWCIDHKDMNYPVLANEVRHYKEDEKGVSIMCKAMEELCNEVANETREELASALIDVGKLSYEEIAQSTKLSIERIQELAASK